MGTNPSRVELRHATFEIIEKIALSGITYKASAHKVYTLSRQKHTATGFPVASFLSFYQAYKNHKTNFKKLLEITNQKFTND